MFIVNIGKEFKGLDNLAHVWERFILPKWNDKFVTPSLVANIIDWCFTVENVVAVDYLGKILENRLDDRKLSKQKEEHFEQRIFVANMELDNWREPLYPTYWGDL